jgi:DNA-binding transcriptional regulator YiaG
MDAGLQIRELAQMLNVTEDTVINWELRGVRQISGNLEKVEMVVARLDLHCIANEQG